MTLIRCGVLLALLVSTGCATGIGNTPIDGTFWWMNPQDARRPIALWNDDLDELETLGLTTMILTGPYVGEQIPPGYADPMDAFFSEADQRGFSLYVDTLASSEWWLQEDFSDEVAGARARIRDLITRYGHFDSFKGFYIPYEIYALWDEDRQKVFHLFQEVAAACKEVAPDKPVLVSPFFVLDRDGYLGDFRWASPDEYREMWTALLGQADIDIVALQDSGEHLAFYTLDDRRPFFEAMAAACDATDTQLWANVELGEMNVTSFEDYVARFGLKTHVNDPRTKLYWRAVPADKLVEKLAFAREFTPTVVSWGYQQFIRPSLGSTATERYLDYYQAFSGKKITKK
jgi:hypothetical protein